MSSNKLKGSTSGISSKSSNSSASKCKKPLSSILPNTLLVRVKKLHQENKLHTMVDKGLKNNYDRIEVEEMVQVALLCTQFHPSHRPKMSEVVRILEGDALADKWEASSQNNADTPKFPPRSSSFEPQPMSPTYLEFVHVVLSVICDYV